MAAVLFRHPRIHTPDVSGRPATALLAVDGTITRVGDHAELAADLPAGTSTVDLPGRAVVAGFHDAHLHSGAYAHSLDALDMHGAASLDEALDRLRVYADKHPDDAWVLGGRWDSNTWDTPLQPTRHDLDRMCGARPVALASIDGHTTWANTVALRAVGITADSPDPAGGRIVREPDGHEPSGILRETAAAPFEHVRGAVDPGDLRRLLERGQRDLLSHGITHITDLDGEDVRDAYLAMRRAGTLALRIHKGIPMSALERAIAEGRATGDGDRWVTTGPVKLFADGALGSHTAHMGHDFADEPGNRGIEVVAFDDLCGMVAKAAAARIAVATHAIGDEAVHLVLNAYERVLATTRRHGLRHRVEHAQHLRPDDVARFAVLGVIPSSQPTHCTTDFALADRMLAGRDLANYPWRRLADAGARLAFGSDAPVEPPAPMYGIHAAVTRQNRAGRPIGGWEAHETVGVAEALAAYSSGSAYAAGLDDRVGRIAVGQYADFVALDDDPLASPEQDLHAIGVEATVVDGTVQFAR